MSTLDRMVFVSFVRSYLIVWASLLSLYVVVDLFTNIDDFAGRGGAVAVAKHVARYYSTRVSQIFDRLSEAITLLAAMFTVAWMQRNNELLPQLSAGIPTRRVIRPVLVGAALTLALGPLNQELLIPRIADELMAPKDDPEGAKAQVIMGAYDSAGVHIEGMVGIRKDRKILRFYGTFPESSPSGMVHLTADEAVYYPPGPGPYTGGWLLSKTVPEVFEGYLPTNLEMLGPGRYFLRTGDVDYDTVTRGAVYFQFASTAKLQDLLARPEPRRLAPLAVTFHMRVTRPLTGALLVLLGLSMILKDQTRHVFISAGLCLAMCVLFYSLVLGCKYLGDSDYVSPPLAAWLPVLVFGPVTLVSFDSIHT